ncbi:MAG: MMPL family transporter [Mycobacteriaceae bacterium]
MNRWSLLITQYRWAVLLSGIAAMLLSGAWGLSVMNHLGSGGFSDPSSESIHVDQVLKEKFGKQSPDIVVVFTRPESRTLESMGDTIGASLNGIDSSLLAQPIITYWNTPLGSSYLRSKDGNKALALIYVAGDENQRISSFNKIAPSLHIPGIDSTLTGFSTLADEIDNQSKADLTFAESLSIPITLIILVVIFGGIVAASLPLLVGILATLGSIAALRVLTEISDVNIFAINVASLLSLGLAIDYGLFIVSRFREELIKSNNTNIALSNTLNSAGRTVGFSALLLICAFAGTLIFPQSMLRSLGFGAMSAVAMAAVLSLTILPAALSILGHRISKWSWHKDAFERGERRAQRFWSRTTKVALRYPALIAATILSLLVLLATPIIGIKLNDIDVTALPSDSPARIGAESISAEFPATNSGVIVLAQTNNGEPALTSSIQQLYNDISNVAGVTSVVLTGSQDGITVLQAQLSVPDRSQTAISVVDNLRELKTPEEIDIEIGGMTAITADSVSAITDRLPIMLAIMALATILLMLLAFGSIILPLKAVFVAFLSLGATFGILTFIFYDGHFANILGISQGPLAAGMVVLVVAVIFGLSTDYEVFLISRIVEAKNPHTSTEEAILVGVTKTGRVVTAAAILLMLVTGAFALSALTPMRFIGIGMIIALTIDATLVRMLLVPTLIKLMGRANWYGPAFLQKRPPINVSAVP